MVNYNSPSMSSRYPAEACHDWTDHWPFVNNLEVSPLQEATHLGFSCQDGLYQLTCDLLLLLVGEWNVPFLQAKLALPAEEQHELHLNGKNTEMWTKKTRLTRRLLKLNLIDLNFNYKFVQISPRTWHWWSRFCSFFQHHWKWISNKGWKGGGVCCLRRMLGPRCLLLCSSFTQQVVLLLISLTVVL